MIPPANLMSRMPIQFICPRRLPKLRHSRADECVLLLRHLRRWPWTISWQLGREQPILPALLPSPYGEENECADGADYDERDGDDDSGDGAGADAVGGGG
jgi:hypothetical protein